jgi:hypothetical protein
MLLLRLSSPLESSLPLLLGRTRALARLTLRLHGLRLFAKGSRRWTRGRRWLEGVAGGRRFLRAGLFTLFVGALSTHE